METSPSLSLLEIRKTLNADPQSVFDALTQRDQLNQWFYAMEKGSAVTEVDLRVGGHYSIGMIDEAGETVATPHGEFLEIDPPHKLSMTWKTTGFVDYSILTFELKPVEEGTELILTHELPDPTVDAHRQGWGSCLANLETLLNSEA